MSVCDRLVFLLPWIDDRAGHFVDLKAEARPRIATDLPSWSDNNDSDPGVTILELSALLLISLVYFGMVVRLLRAVGVIDRVNWAVTIEQGWSRVDDLSESGPEDRHYVIDPETGAMRFGDGVHGAIPPSGSGEIRSSYRVGGGTAGSVGAAVIVGRSSDPVVSASTSASVVS